ncbi:hypothetical protein SAMN05444171_2386 [Bradyrhizobium lablabi]|uniref:Uncharacterized protein n=2 Tax=Bradyrhizobium TaxID=374 RepID=A0ABY0PYZ0_9BRAD|nr:hypothetical protein SAMN05444163_4777 [Bradyrhizobium ottawaense]SEC84043.1 hypothetical protein SAMN05444171_2386 [Bradyrhizobium lablabi]SHK93901.1 hypothetical protein SAMN05444321_1211 [Bradyrhizobium lablabi]
MGQKLRSGNRLATSVYPDNRTFSDFGGKSQSANR